MQERELTGVQERPRHREAVADAAVEVVAEHRVADRRQVHADLVGASRLELAGQQRGGDRVVELRVDPVVGPRRVGRRRRRSCAADRVATVRSARRPPPGGAPGGARPSPCRRGSRCGSTAGAPAPRRPPGVRATTSRPEVPRSRRWTSPGRSGSPTSASSGNRASSPCTSVEPEWPAPGCTTRPAGLSITMMSSSLNTTRTSMSGSGFDGLDGPDRLGQQRHLLTLDQLDRGLRDHVRRRPGPAPSRSARTASAREQPGDERDDPVDPLAGEGRGDLLGDERRRSRSSLTSRGASDSSAAGSDESSGAESSAPAPSLGRLVGSDARRLGDRAGAAGRPARCRRTPPRRRRR